MNSLCVAVTLLVFYAAGTVAVCPTDNCLYCQDENNCAVCAAGFDRVENNGAIGCESCDGVENCRLCRTAGNCKNFGCDPGYVSKSRVCYGGRTIDDCDASVLSIPDNVDGCAGCPEQANFICTAARHGYFVDVSNNYIATPCTVEGCKFCHQDVTLEPLLGDICYECEEGYEYEATQVNKPTCIAPDPNLAEFERIRVEALAEIDLVVPLLSDYVTTAAALRDEAEGRDATRRADIRALRRSALSADRDDLVAEIEVVLDPVTKSIGILTQLRKMTTNQFYKGRQARTMLLQLADDLIAAAPAK